MKKFSLWCLVAAFVFLCGGCCCMSCKNGKDDIFIAAHRGFSAKYPENTLIAFEKAMELPIDAIEFDLHPTADGKIVLAHDHKLDRLGIGKGYIREKSFAELEKLDFGAWKGKEFAGIKVAQFNELLDLVEKKNPDIFLCVEIKENNKKYTFEILEELKKRGRLYKCSIISFHPDISFFVHEYDPKIQVHGFEGLEYKMNDYQKANYFRILDRIGMPIGKVTAEKVKKYHALGIKVDVWAPDTEKDYKFVRDCGVDFVTTNAPDVVAKAAGR